MPLYTSQGQVIGGKEVKGIRPEWEEITPEQRAALDAAAKQQQAEEAALAAAENARWEALSPEAQQAEIDALALKAAAEEEADRLAGEEEPVFATRRYNSDGQRITEEEWQVEEDKRNGPHVATETENTLAAGLEAMMVPLVGECDARVAAVLKSQQELALQIEHLYSELDRFMSSSTAQDTQPFAPYVQKLETCQSRLDGVNHLLCNVGGRLGKLQRQLQLQAGA